MADLPCHGWVLAGPTASGKTGLGHRLARDLGLSVISADAMAVYRLLDVGTAKPTLAERKGLEVLGIDLAHPDQPFSVHDYLGAVQRQLGARRGTGPLVVVGGTGLYLTALLRGLGERPPPDPALRHRLQSILDDRGVAGLQAEAERMAPGLLSRLADPLNPRRVIRAVEQAALGIAPVPATGQVLPAVVALRRPREDLDRRIRERVDRMFDCGLLEEVKALRCEGIRLSATAAQAIGYAEAVAVLDGALAEPQAREQVVLRTRQLAKRQMTWLRHQVAARWLDVTPGADEADLAAQVRRMWEEHGPARLAI